MIHDNGVSNNSGNRPFEDVLKASVSRRNVLVRSAALSATGFLSALAGNKALVHGVSAATTGEPASALAELNAGTALAQRRLPDIPINFPALPIGDAVGPIPKIAEGYQFESLIPWGPNIQGLGEPSYDGDPNRRPSAAEQIEQVGIGHDGMWFFAIDGSNDRGMLAINHEFGTNFHVLGKDDPESLEDVRTSQHAHGVSVVELRKIRGRWVNVPSRNARRIHVNTPVTFSGPVVGSTLLETPAGNAPKGTVNNCANGYTPWGTYLTCEENFNGYFGATGEWTPTPEQERYGFSPTGFGYGWYNFDARFDLSNPQYKNEENRFGWVVEIDPMNGSQVPVKRTALGRFKHEGVGLTEGKDGRVVLYMGDDERFDYLYKFVSAYDWRRMIARGVSPLDEGTLYVAKFNEDGTGEWLPMDIDQSPVLRENFSSQAEVLTYARLAADALGATPMDRPEWTTVGPLGVAYVTLTNNSQRTEPNPPKPLAPNPDGHILRWRCRDGLIGTEFVWDIYVLSQDTQSDPDAAFASPDGLWADPDGRLFIETDGSQPQGINDQLLVGSATDPTEIRRLFSGVTSCEITGIAVTPDRRTMFVNIQHPGDGDPTLTNYPAAQGSGKIPRDCTIVITKKDGGIVGS